MGDLKSFQLSEKQKKIIQEALAMPPNPIALDTDSCDPAKPCLRQAAASVIQPDRHFTSFMSGMPCTGEGFFQSLKGGPTAGVNHVFGCIVPNEPDPSVPVSSISGQACTFSGGLKSFLKGGITGAEYGGELAPVFPSAAGFAVGFGATSFAVEELSFHLLDCYDLKQSTKLPAHGIIPTKVVDPLSLLPAPMPTPVPSKEVGDSISIKSLLTPKVRSAFEQKMYGSSAGGASVKSASVKLRTLSGLPGTERFGAVAKNLSMVSGMPEEAAKEVVRKLMDSKECGKPSLQDVNAKLDKISSIQQGLMEQMERQVEMQNINVFLGFLGSLNIPELKTTVICAQSAMQIYSATASLVSAIATGASTGSMLGPIGMIGGTVLSLVSFFSQKDGPNPTAIILQQLQHISQQIINLHKAMEEHFKGVFDLQIETMRIIREGFLQLSMELQQVSQQLGGFRVELLSRLANIETAIAIVLKHQHLMARSILVQELQLTFTQADLLIAGRLGGDQNAIKQAFYDLHGRLHNGIMQVTTNKFLTGACFFGEDACELSEHEQEKFPLLGFIGKPTMPLSDRVLNSFLGYLVIHVKKILSQTTGGEIVPNLLIWSDAVEKYISLKKHFVRLDLITDPDHAILDKIIQQGQATIHFIDFLKSNSEFWKFILANYYKTVKEIEQVLVKFCAAYNHNRMSKFNRLYQENSLIHGQGLDKLDLWDLPEHLFAKFKTLTMAPDLRDKRLHYVYGRLAPEIRAAEYLGLIKFIVNKKEETREELLKKFDIHQHINLFVSSSITGQFPMSFKFTGDLAAGPVKIESYTIKEDGATCAISTSMIPEELEQRLALAINEEYLNARKEMARILLAKSASEEEAIYVEQFNRLLGQLDKQLRLIQCYVHLMGNEVNNSCLDTLLTSDKIYQDLIFFRDHKCTLKQSLLPCLEKFLKQPQLEYKSINDIAKQRELSREHPLVLLALANKELIGYKVNRDIAANLYPNLVKHIDTYVYAMTRFFVKEEVFQRDTYAWLQEICISDFDKAKDRLIPKSKQVDATLLATGSLTKEKYISSYQTILEWATTRSLKPIFKGEVSDLELQATSIGVQKPGKIVANLLDNTTVLGYILKRFGTGNWRANIGLLRKFSELCGVKYGEELVTLPYPDMWLDGVRSLLQIIYDEKLMTIAKQAGSTFETKAKNLQSCHIVGRSLKIFINKVGLSRNFFVELFAGHIQMFNELIGLIQEEQTRNTAFNDKVVIDILLNPTHSSKDPFAINGVIANLLDKNQACTLLIKTYIDMVFGCYFSDPRFQHLVQISLVKEKFLEKLANRGTSSVIVVMQQHLKTIKLFHDSILYKIDKVHDILATYNYLESYFNEQPECQVLTIDGNKLLTVGLTAEIMNLLDKFLEIYSQRITKVEFVNLPIGKDELEMIVQVLKNKTYITRLGLSYANLDLSILNILKPILPRLEALDLSGNNFGMFIGGAWVNFIISNAKILQMLNLSDNDLDATALCAIIVSCKNLIKLVDVDFSNNPRACKDGVSIIIDFLIQHPNMHRLSLANTGITPAACSELSSCDEEVQLAELDLSRNAIFSDDFSENLNVLYLFSPMTRLKRLFLRDDMSIVREKGMDSLRSIVSIKLDNLVQLDIGIVPDTIKTTLTAIQQERPTLTIYAEKNPLPSVILTMSKGTAIESFEQLILINPEYHSQCKTKFSDCLNFIDQACSFGQLWLDDMLSILQQTIYLLMANFNSEQFELLKQRQLALLERVAASSVQIEQHYDRRMIPGVQQQSIDRAACAPSPTVGSTKLKFR